jgi:hypothetical protein
MLDQISHAIENFVSMSVKFDLFHAFHSLSPSTRPASDRVNPLPMRESESGIKPSSPKGRTSHSG